MNIFLKLQSKLIVYRLISNMDYYERYYWFNNIGIKEINNLLKLKIKSKMLRNMKWLITDLDLLDCDDYVERINYLSKINPNLYDTLYVIRSFGYLKSPHLIEDLEIIKNNPLSDFLDLLKSPIFMNSKYHVEDLKLIVNEYKKSKDIDYLIKLACSEVSIKSKYHLDNMQELAKKSSEFVIKYLYLLMTNEKVIKNKFYCKYIEFLADAKSEIKANVIYSYIKNHIIDNENGNQNLECSKANDFSILSLLLQTKDSQISIIYNIVTNPSFINSKNKEFYLKILKILNILSDKMKIDKDIYIYLTYIISLNDKNSKFKILNIIKNLIETCNKSLNSDLNEQIKKLEYCEMGK